MGTSVSRSARTRRLIHPEEERIPEGIHTQTRLVKENTVTEYRDTNNAALRRKSELRVMYTLTQLILKTPFLYFNDDQLFNPTI